MTRNEALLQIFDEVEIREGETPQQAFDRVCLVAFECSLDDDLSAAAKAAKNDGWTHFAY